MQNVFNNQLELLRNKQECVKLDKIFIAVIGELERSNYLNDKELKRLEQARKDLIRLEGFNQTIDKHLQKFLS